MPLTSSGHVYVVQYHPAAAAAAAAAAVVVVVLLLLVKTLHIKTLVVFF